MRTWLAILFAIVAVSSAASELYAQSPTPTKRDGVFLLKGTLVNAAKVPLVGWTVMVVGDKRRVDPRYPQLNDNRYSLNDNGQLIYRGYAGEGTTGPDGHFEFSVSKSKIHFNEDQEIKFRLFVMGLDKGLHEPIKAKQQDGSEAEAVFKADKAADTVDLLKMTGKPIVLGH